MKCHICNLTANRKCGNCKKDTCDLHLLKTRKFIILKKMYCQHCFYDTAKKSVF